MGLAEVQAALARLYTDPAFREMLENDPEALQRACGLSDEDLEHLKHLSAAELEFFAASLRSKRRGEVAKLLPETVAALGGQYRLLFNEHAANYLPPAKNKHLEDALHFAEFLEHISLPDKPWVPSTIAYERAWLEISSGRRFLIVRRLNYSIDTLLRSTHPERANLVVIWVHTRLTGTHHWILKLPGTRHS